MNGVLQRLGILSRLPQRILAAHSDRELREELATCLKGLYRKPLQFEIFSREVNGSFDPWVKVGEGQVATAHKLLGALTSRLRMRDEASDLLEAHLLAPQLGVKRGALMSAPLIDGGDIIGLVVVEAIGGGDFTPTDLDLLEGVTALFSLALQRIRHKESEYAQVRIELDLKAAGLVQRRLMSRSLPAGIGVTAYAEYLPAYDVGGDFYDLVQTGPGRISAVIGDVSGKGVTAALVMSRVLSELRRHMDAGCRPSAVLTVVNDDMQREDSEIFATASCLSIDARTRMLEVSSAGHLPVVIRRSSGQVFTFGNPSGTPLGMLPSEYGGEALNLDPQDIVLLMTDGLVEALDRPSDRMGMQLLLSLIKYAPHDPKLIIERSLAAVHKMKGPKLADDVTLVALQLDS